MFVMAACGSAQVFVTLEQAASRSGRDMAATYEGRAIAVRAQVASAPIWALGTYYLPLRDSTDHGLLLRGEGEQFSDLAPGDWIEAAGTIQSRAALPLLAPESIHKFRHEAAPEPKELSLAEIAGLRYLGLLVRTTGTVASVGENLGGRSFEITDRGTTTAVFLPRGANSNASELRRIRAGDHVRVSALATQYSLDPPHNNGFQLMLASAAGVEAIHGTSSVFSPLLLLSAALAIGLLAVVWWIRERRLGAHRQSMRAFHALSEDIISAGSPSDIAEKLATELPEVTQATGVRLYIYNRRSKSLERVPTRAEPDPMAVPIECPPDGLASGAALCFRNRTLLNVPDVRRSPFVRIDRKMNLPRSAMFVPLLSKDDILGILEIGNARRLGYFTVEEQAAAQHLANQVAASLKLQDRQSVREQLFRSEKLAATGQLISGVASELRAPLDSIVRLASSLAESRGRPTDSDLRFLASESRRAAEIVSRLVSFARPEDSGARPVDLNGLIAGLMQFREPEWKMLALRVQNRVSTEAAMVLGAQGQIEQVFLSLLVHAEQCAADAPAKSITVQSSVIARRALIEIGFAVKDTAAADPFAEGRSSENGGLGLAVCKGIIQTHGGEIRFGAHAGTARFEIDLPLAGVSAKETVAPSPPVSRTPRVPLTLMLIEPDAGAQRQLIAMLSARGHRVVPTPVEQAADLAQRLRFDAVLWAVRPSNARFAEVQKRIRALVGAFVLVSDGYDAELAHSLEEGGSFLLARPVQESELDRLIPSGIAARSAGTLGIRR